jgi:hypothetical protein
LKQNKLRRPDRMLKERHKPKLRKRLDWKMNKLRGTELKLKLEQKLKRRLKMKRMQSLKQHKLRRLHLKLKKRLG